MTMMVMTAMTMMVARVSEGLAYWRQQLRSQVLSAMSKADSIATSPALVGWYDVRFSLQKSHLRVAPCGTADTQTVGQHTGRSDLEGSPLSPPPSVSLWGLGIAIRSVWGMYV